MDTTTLKIDNSNPMALAFLEFVKTLPFVKVELPSLQKVKVATATKKEVLEEDEDGIPIAYYDLITELSRDVKKGFARRYFETMEKKYAEK